MALVPADRVGPQDEAKAALAAAGYSMRRLARDHDLQHENLSAMLNGRLTVSEPYRDAIEATTGCSVRELFHERLWVNTHWHMRELRESRVTTAASGGGPDA